MDEPGSQGDERVLIRSAGVHVKSISFEASLTNKRIILMDRLKSTLQQKEIPLATIQAVEAGENAIRETTLTLSAIAKNGRTRQMVLTFSNAGGGSRVKECNEWIRLLKANVAFPIEPVTRMGVPAQNPVQKAGPAHSPEFGRGGAPVPQRSAGYYETEKPQPLRKIVEPPSPVAYWQAPEVQPDIPVPGPASAAPESILGTYCTRCGAKVPEGSGFCNRCGSRIITPNEVPQVTVATPAPLTQTIKKEVPTGHETSLGGSFTEPISKMSPRETRHTLAPEPVTGWENQQAAEPVAAQPHKGFFSRLHSTKDTSLPSRPQTMSPVKPRRSRKKLVVALVIIIVIIIAVVAFAVLLPKLGTLKSVLPESNSSVTSASTATPTVAGDQAVTTKPTVPPLQGPVVTSTRAVINQATSVV